MNVLTIMGTAHKGNTRAVVDLFLKEFEDDKNEFDEIILPNDFQNFCQGCANCILKGEDKCPHYKEVNKIVEKIEKADLIILATPVFVGSCTGGMKAFLDHLAYMWLVHRPNENMFNKVGLIVTSAGGSGVKQTVKLLKNNLFYWGVPRIYNYGITTKIRTTKNQLPTPWNITYEGEMSCVHNGLVNPNKLDDYKKTYMKEILARLEKGGVEVSEFDIKFAEEESND